MRRSFNAVKSITGPTAASIGGDMHGNRYFDFTEGATVVAGFQFHDDAGDTDDVPIDGFVLVKAGGFTPDPKTVLLTPVITVP